MTTSTTSIDIMGLQAAYANLHPDQEGDYFMQRYDDVISSFGGKTSYDADNRPLLVMRSNLWASGYAVDGTDQTSLGQVSGLVHQTHKHSVQLAMVMMDLSERREVSFLDVFNRPINFMCCGFLFLSRARCLLLRMVRIRVV